MSLSLFNTSLCTTLIVYLQLVLLSKAVSTKLSAVSVLPVPPTIRLYCADLGQRNTACSAESESLQKIHLSFSIFFIRASEELSGVVVTYPWSQQHHAFRFLIKRYVHLTLVLESNYRCHFWYNLSLSRPTTISCGPTTSWILFLSSARK